MTGRLKNDAEYFWMYFKLPFCAALILIVVFTYFLVARATEKERVFQALLFDVHTETSEHALEQSFADYAGIDVKHNRIDISTSLLLSDATSNYAMTSLSKFYTQIGTEDLDFVMMYEEDFSKLTNAETFLDLRELLTEAELSRFPKLYTALDGTVLGVYGNELPMIQAIDGYSTGAESVAGIPYNTRHPEMARQFLLYLLESY